jgi:aminocarboxymuconate-semialdehyde decarboxylase
MSRERPVVDIHSHLYPRWYIDLLKARTEIPRVSGAEGDERFVIFPDEAARGSGGGRPITDDYWSIETKLAFMDRHGIDRTVLSLGNPWFDPFASDASLAGARRLNDDFATLAERTGDRITGMGALPGGSVDDVVTVVGEVAERDGLAGAVSGTRIAGHTLDEEALEPVWEALERRGVPLLLHPHHGSAMDELRGFGHALPVAVAFPVETTVALARLVLAGVLHRHPGLLLVASHGGGTLPYLAGRLDAGWRSDASLAVRAPSPPSSVLGQLYLDAVLYHARALAAAADLVGTEHLAFGTDHPFSIADPQANLAAVEAAFGDVGAERVLSGTARDLYGRRARRS